MILSRNQRGFEVLEHEFYAEEKSRRLVQQSSAVGDYEDSFDHPGSSYLWIGENHHLNREEIEQLVRHLQSWLNTGSLEEKEIVLGSP